VKKSGSRKKSARKTAKKSSRGRRR
jgi:hypothetical protein